MMFDNEDETPTRTIVDVYYRVVMGRSTRYVVYMRRGS